MIYCYQNIPKAKEKNNMAENRCYGCMQPRSDGRFCEYCGFEYDKPNESHQLPTGTVLKGQYLVGKVLGQGGFGITYLGWDLYLNIPVAIKEYYPVGTVIRESARKLSVTHCEGMTGSAFEDNRRRFLREAQTLAQLSNVPEVVQVRNFFPENETAYIIMEYIRGRTLKDYLREHGLMTMEQVLTMMRPAMEGLKKVHAAGLIHRDISPDNIMVLPDGRIKLLDFGSVRDLVAYNANHATQAILKPGFAPLEQYNSKGDVGPWTDVYGLCCTMYYCMTGKVPMNAPERAMEQLGIGWEKVPGLSPSQIRALNQGTDLYPQNRPQNMQELENVLDSGENAAVYTAPILRKGHHDRDKTVYTAPLIPEQPTVVPPEVPGNPYGTPEQPPKKKSKVLPVLIVLILLIAALAVCFFTVHIWEEATCTEPRTCTICGKTEGEENGHSWSKATCTEPKVCKDCGISDGEAKGHDWAEATCTTPKTCKACGETKGDVSGHQWKSATCTEPETCKSCGETKGTANGHQWKNATCTTAKTCSVCNKTEGAPLGHSWKAATYNTPKTCTRCNVTEGKALGYLENVTGDLESVHLGNCNTHALVFDTPLRNCSGFTLNFEVSFNSNSYANEWKLYYRDTNGKWKVYGNFELNGNSAYLTYKFNPKLNISAVAVIPVKNGGYSWTQTLWITYAYI